MYFAEFCPAFPGDLLVWLVRIELNDLSDMVFNAVGPCFIGPTAEPGVKWEHMSCVFHSPAGIKNSRRLQALRVQDLYRRSVLYACSLVVPIALSLGKEFGLMGSSSVGPWMAPASVLYTRSVGRSDLRWIGHVPPLTLCYPNSYASTIIDNDVCVCLCGR